MKKKYRIKKETEFREIMNERHSFANKNLVVYIKKREGSFFRVGLSVGKKVGNAVERNKVKRFLRLALTEMREEIDSNYDLILIARPAILTLSYEEVKKNIHHVLSLANVIKR
ncbi:ribonuclease P protein component [Vagococcus elongatus]|uniref:Ribonuclease P protein component n=1 Tax=Vagococcus elongatus TaxID=180344 RepID=A0A430AUZ2_9ENTE|nr:ribonuclease P protein component [Vagococcus elongatus]RSU11865.1 ribonuclease P protein component [Vagococcus elongatus]